MGTIEEHFPPASPSDFFFSGTFYSGDRSSLTLLDTIEQFTVCALLIQSVPASVTESKAHASTLFPNYRLGNQLDRNRLSGRSYFAVGIIRLNNHSLIAANANLSNIAISGAIFDLQKGSCLFSPNIPDVELRRNVVYTITIGRTHGTHVEFDGRLTHYFAKN